MKKSLLICIFVLASTTLFGQLSFDKSEVIVNEPDSSKEEAVGIAHLKNKSGNQVMINWEAKVNKIQQGWDDYYCLGACFNLGVRKGTIELYFPVDNQEELTAHMIPHNLCGMSEIEFTVAEVGNPTNSASTKFIFNVCASSTNDLNPEFSELEAYPNPTVEGFQLTNILSAKRIDIYNILGMKVKTFNNELNKYFDIEELNQGLYLVRVVGENNKIMKTIKLNKKNK